METLQSSMTSNHHPHGVNSGSPQKTKCPGDELRTDMYESLTNGECFSQPKFEYSQYEKIKNESAMVAPNDAFKPLRDSDDDDLIRPQDCRSSREERLYYGRDYNRFGIRISAQRSEGGFASVKQMRETSPSQFM